MPRQSFKEYQSEAWYEAWRSGGNPDALEYDKLRDSYDAGMPAEEAARSALPKRRTDDDEQHDSCECTYCMSSGGR
jgi:hypothetical protein